MSKRCKICLVQTELDGRCRSCATALAATNAGMTYGKYVAKFGNDPAACRRPRTTVPTDIIADSNLRCAVCGAPVPEGTRRTLYCSPDCARVGQRQKARDYYRANHSTAPQTCIVCGKMLPQTMHRSSRICSDACRAVRRNDQRKQRYHRARE